MKTKKNEDPKVTELLKELDLDLDRKPESTSRGRARFLAESAFIRSTLGNRSRKQHSNTRRWVLNFSFSLILIIFLLFSGSAGVALAAQNTIPGDSLYPVKLLSEDLRLGFTADPGSEIELLLQFIQHRVEECNQLVSRGSTPGEGLQQRTELQLASLLQITASLENGTMQATLMRIRSQLETREQALHAGTPLQFRNMFKAQIRNTEAGLNDPSTFRNTWRHRGRTGQGSLEIPGPQSTTPSQVTSTGNDFNMGSTPTPSGNQSPTNGTNSPQFTPGSTQGGDGGMNGQGGKP